MESSTSRTARRRQNRRRLRAESSLQEQAELARETSRNLAGVNATEIDASGGSFSSGSSGGTLNPTAETFIPGEALGAWIGLAMLGEELDANSAAASTNPANVATTSTAVENGITAATTGDETISSNANSTAQGSAGPTTASPVDANSGVLAPSFARGR